MDPNQQPNIPPQPIPQAPAPGAFDVVMPPGQTYQPTVAGAPTPPAPVPVVPPVAIAPQSVPVPNIPAAAAVQPPMPVAAPPAGHVPAKAMSSNPNSTQNTLMIAEIRDGIVIMNDGSFRAVIMCKSINFDLMSPQEREAVEYAYQGFLNSLYFDIQIYIRSQRVDIRPYIDKLDRLRRDQDNLLLGYLMDDYIEFMSALAQETNIMDKRFYIVIPYYPNADAKKAVENSRKLLSGLFQKNQQVVTINEGELEKAKTEMRNQVQAVLSGLMQVGLQAVPLDTQELIELYYDSYNPDTATRQRLSSIDGVGAPIVTKGSGVAPQPQLDRELEGMQ